VTTSVLGRLDPGYYYAMAKKALSATLIVTLLTVAPALAADLYLVRHAEKETDGSRDPALTLVGSQRAADLALLLKSTKIQRIFSTDFTRTRKTAAPTAEMAGADIEIYDPMALEPFAELLLELETNALVVGHSDTTPDLIELMGGDGGTPIVEAWEYDRVYLVQTAGGRVTRTILLHLPPSRVPADSEN
jgi:probable phosphoglycerate mutase